MAEIHRKRPLIVKRMTTWKRKGVSEPKPKKKNIHAERVKEGAKVIGGAIWGGLKSVGKSLADPKTQRKLGDIGYNAGSMSREFFSTGFSTGYDEPRRRTKKKSKKSKR